MLQCDFFLQAVQVGRSAVREKIEDRRFHALDISLLDSNADQAGRDTLGAGMDDVLLAFLKRMIIHIGHDIAVPDDGHVIDVVPAPFDLFQHGRQFVRVHALSFRGGSSPGFRRPIVG